MRVDRAVAFASAALLCACAGEVSDKRAPVLQSEPPGPPTTLAGRQFVSQSVEGRELVPGTEIRLSFSANALSAYAGCHHLSGPYRVEGNVLRVERLPPAGAACDQARHEQDWWLQQLLIGSPRFALDGWRLTLATADRVVLIDRKKVSAQ